jgi:hypothetical protein
MTVVGSPPAGAVTPFDYGRKAKHWADTLRAMTAALREIRRDVVLEGEAGRS